MGKHGFLDEIYYIDTVNICNSLYIDSFGINILREELITVAHIKNDRIVEKVVKKDEIFTTKSAILESLKSKDFLIQENEIDREKIKQYFLGKNTHEGETIWKSLQLI